MLTKHHKLMLPALILTSILLMTSCNEGASNGIDDNPIVEEQESEPMEEEESQPTSGSDIEDDPQLNENTDEDEFQNNDSNRENENETDEDYSDENTLDAEEILTKSFTAMSDLTGLSMEVDMDIVETIDGVTVEEKRWMDTEMLVKEPFLQHFKIKIDSNMEDINEVEVYKIENTDYIHTSYDNTWRAIPTMEMANQDTNQLASFIAGVTLDDYLLHGSQFEVIEDEDSFLLTFSGAYDEFMSAVYGGTQAMLVEIGIEYYYGIEYVNNAFSITIQKDDYLVKQYNISFEGKAPDDEGDYQYSEDTIVTLDKFNQVDAIIVPDEIVAEAVTMAGNDG